MKRKIAATTGILPMRTSLMDVRVCLLVGTVVLLARRRRLVMQRRIAATTEVLPIWTPPMAAMAPALITLVPLVQQQ